MTFCQHPSQLYLGRLNEDNLTDVICHQKGGALQGACATKTGIFTTVQWRSSFKWCIGSHRTMHFGDFNGDAQDDMLCHDTSSGDMWIAFANSKGYYHGTDWHMRTPWCIEQNDTLIVGDFNGNGRADLLCHNRKSGKKSVAYADCDGEFKGPEWSAFHGWCKNYQAEILVGDFNGDGRDDLLCNDHQKGKSIAFANYDGKFKGNYWEDNNMTWCSRDNDPQGAVNLLIGDFNGDGRSDWLCHTLKTGFIRILFSSKRGEFGGLHWQRAMKWCKNKQTNVGHFNKDRLSDLLCHSNQGQLWISYGECYGKQRNKKG